MNVSATPGSVGPGVSAITEGAAGALTGVEAVVDKDYVSALLVIAGTTITSWCRHYY